MSILPANETHELLDQIPGTVASVVKLLHTLNPLLNQTLTINEITDWMNAFVHLILDTSLDFECAIQLGEQLEELDNLQPGELLRVLEILPYKLLDGISNRYQLLIYPHLLTAISAVLSGFYTSKARRRVEFDMSAISRMGHDLKTPINAITGFSHIMLKEIDGPLTEFQREDLTSIYEAGKKLLMMINEFTDLMKQDAQRTSIYPAEFAVSDLVAEVLAGFQPACSAAEFTLVFQLERNLGTVYGNASELRWILFTLLMYLLHHSSHEVVALLANRRLESNQVYLVFHLTDNRDKINHIDHNGEVQIPSTELINRDIGLATAWRFCADMEGRLIMLEGTGITFEVMLPVKNNSDYPAFIE
ncbi:MAG: histidine kinase dimerization/phospho-acceptor domain-containing protein [Anaerolineae bacterium]|nr:histidine kinase dimerization/phospho-acceptor domain-containing protein [Anaerolineae bacterium]